MRVTEAIYLQPTGENPGEQNPRKARHLQGLSDALMSKGEKQLASREPSHGSKIGRWAPKIAGGINMITSHFGSKKAEGLGLFDDDAGEKTHRNPLYLLNPNWDRY